MKAFWRWTGTIFFALTFVFLTMAGIGTSLPIDHHAWCAATYNRPATLLFAAVEADNTSVFWRPTIKSALLISGRGPSAVWRETDVYGKTLTYRTLADDGNATLVRQIDFVPGMPFAGTWAYKFSPGGETIPRREPSTVTQLTIIEDGRIYNPLFRFLARYVFGYTQTMQTYLVDLGKIAGERPSVMCAANP